MTYRPDIDGLRALAIGLVVVFHFNIFSVGKAGFIGVDVFFVLSGFLITGIIARDLEAGRFAFGSFLYRRVRRLYPAMLATLLLYGLYGYFRFLPPKFQELATETLLSQLYVINFYFWRTVNYFGLQAGEVPLLHMWSLAVEEQFYLLFPIFCLLVFRWGARALFWAVVALCVLSFGLGLVATPIKPWAAFYLLPTRAWELLAGSVLALALLHRTPSAALSQIAGPVGLALVAASIWVYTPVTPVPGWFALLPTLGAVALITGGYAQKAALTRGFSWAPLVWIGKISYPLYLVHWPILIAMKDGLADFTLPWRVTGLGLSVLVAWGIYRFIETPIRTGRVLNAPRRFMVGWAGVTGGLIAAMFVVWNAQGLPNRFDSEVVQIQAYGEDHATAFRHCDQQPIALDRLCILGDPAATPTRLIFGDSHANALARPADLWLKARGEAALFTFRYACAPVLGAGRADCATMTRQVVDLARQSEQITDVMIVSIWRYAYSKTGLLFDGKLEPPARAPARFAEALGATVQTLAESGTQVTLIEPMFSAPRNVPDTLAKNRAFGRTWEVNRPLADHRADFARLFDAFAHAETLGAKRVSLIEDLCASGTCQSVLEGRPVFSDVDHIADGLAPHFAEILAREMPR